jgi:hypothetical protein
MSVLQNTTVQRPLPSWQVELKEPQPSEAVKESKRSVWAVLRGRPCLIAAPFIKEGRPRRTASTDPFLLADGIYSQPSSGWGIRDRSPLTELIRFALQ